MGLILAAIVATVGAVAFNVPIPWANLPVVLVVLIVGAATFCAWGLAIAGLVPNASSAPAVVNAIILPLLFISNTFIRIKEGMLREPVGGLFPVRPFSEMLQALWDPRLGTFEPISLLWVAAWGIAGLLVAMRTFTWEPRA